jgi:hypothetical protein
MKHIRNINKLGIVIELGKPKALEYLKSLRKQKITSVRLTYGILSDTTKKKIFIANNYAVL